MERRNHPVRYSGFAFDLFRYSKHVDYIKTIRARQSSMGHEGGVPSPEFYTVLRNVA